MRLADDEVAESLYPRYGFQLFRIHEISIELNRIGFAEQLNQEIVLAEQIIRQRSYAEPLLTGAEQAQYAVEVK